MRCEELTDDLLLDYVDRRLAKYDMGRIVAHLGACRHCLERTDELHAMAGALPTAGPACPPALLEHLDAEVLGAFGRTRRRARLPLALAAAAALAMAALLLDWMLTPRAAPFAAAGHAHFPPSPSAMAEGQRPPVPPAAEAPRVPLPRPPPFAVKPPDPPPPPPVIAGPPEPRSDPLPFAATAPARAALPGDVNDDGQVDIADARIIQQSLLRGTPVPKGADANGDGAVDVADVRLIARREVLAP